MRCSCSLALARRARSAPVSPGPSACPSRATWRCPSSGKTCTRGCSRLCRTRMRTSRGRTGSAASSRPDRCRIPTSGRRSSAPWPRPCAGGRSRRRAGHRVAGNRVDKDRTGCGHRPARASNVPDNLSWMLSYPRKLALLPLCHLVERNVQPRAPEIGGQPRLVLQRGEKLARLRERFPDLRQECGPVVIELEGDAVDARAKARAQLILGVEAPALQRRKERDLDRCRLEFVRRQRWKARVAECRGDCIFAHVEPDVPSRSEARSEEHTSELQSRGHLV